MGIGRKIFELDLHKIDLYCFESSKTDYFVASICSGIEHGDVFRPVRVSPQGNGSFRLADLADGGHHRAVAHYIMDKPLACVLFYPDSRTRNFNYLDCPIHVRDIVIRDGNYDSYVRQLRYADAGMYRPVSRLT
jgi:hypothetical protein